MSSVVNWEGELSKPFLERQVGIISPSAYKMFLNPLLNLYSANSLSILFLAGTAIELQEMICV